MAESALILLIVFAVFNLLNALTKFIEVRTKSYQGTFSYTQLTDKEAVKRIYNRCCRKWRNPKNTALRAKFKTLDEYITSEVNKAFDYERFYYAREEE